MADGPFTSWDEVWASLGVCVVWLVVMVGVVNLLRGPSDPSDD